MSVPNIHEIAVKRKIEAKRLGLGHLENNKVNAAITRNSESEEELAMGTVVGKYSTSPVSAAPLSYYGINIPCEYQDGIISKRFLHVYTDKLEAMNVVKQHKKARFKVFKSRQEAIDFAFHPNTDLFSSSSTVPETFESRFRPSSPTVGEKPSLFKGPKAQDLVKLRKSIESGDMNVVQTMIWENPRYLVSSGDTPAILQEGSRYNALHIAAKAKNAFMTDLILRTVTDSKFMGLLYGDDNIVHSEDRIRILLDLYLNTPDKGLNETPLHFAVKYGASKVIEVLVSYPQCDKQPRNKYNQVPKDIVCSRVNSPNAWLKDDICALLDGHFYVPVLRSEDHTVQPIVGKPFSPKMFRAELNDNRLDTRVEIRAYAGPMNQQQADAFHKKLKTPPRMRQPILNPWRLADTEKGLEREGRDLAQQLKVGWKEYWSFLDTFADLSTPEGLQLLENYLYKRVSPEGDACENNDTPEKRFFKTEHIISSNGSPNCNRVTSREISCPKSPLSPMSDLCLTLQACSLLNSSSESNNESPKHAKQDTVYNRGEWRTRDTNGMVSQEEQVLLGMLTKPGLSPFLYVDKSCQVFGKRIADGLTHIAVGEHDSNGYATLEFLKQEMKHLQSLVNSYMDDPRFVSVDFHLVHSRIASIVQAKLETLSQEEFEAVFDICLLIDSCQKGSHVSSDEDDLNVGASTYRNQAGMDKRKKSEAEISRIHVDCITHLISLSIKSFADSHQDKNVANSENVHYQTEEGCMQIWADAVKCSCPWPVQSFVRNSRKGSSYRLKYTTNKELIQAQNEQEGKDVRCNLESLISLSDDSNSMQDSNLLLNDMQSLDNSDANSDGGDVDSEEELFFTCPSSPDYASEESSEDEMESPEEGDCIFIEGSTIPSQIDVSVLEALEQCTISPAEYPNIYQWRHSVLLHMTRGTSIARSSLAQGSTTLNSTQSSQQLDGKSDYAFSLHENWHNVIPPSSPFSPQFKRTVLNRKF